MNPNPTLVVFVFVFAFLFLDDAVLCTSSLELMALLSLKSSLVDPNSALRDWALPTPVCSWFGVTCHNATRRVVGLDLSGRNLSGAIPVQLQHLTHLSHLNLSHNAFQGPFPGAAIFSIRSLETLDINHNSFNSTFPPGISNLTLLNVLDCYSNSFVGSLPDELSGQNHEHLQILNLGGSYFEGPIPPGYGGFQRLTFLHLAGNNLDGSIPPELGRLGELQWMQIGYNAGLSGEIPPEFGQLSKLSYMDVSNSNLSGSIPPELGNLTMLNTLQLFNNRLTGSIPLTISKLKSLQILDFSGNQLTGDIPEGISELKELNVISLLTNNLTGGVPPGIGDLPNLQFLQLWNNSLTGPLPASLGENGKLVKLDVSTNYLSGPLPENLCKGNKLGRLVLFSNRFSGQLPNSLANCTSLNRVRVQNNLFTGAIPAGFGNLPNLTFFDLSTNNFTGPIPTDLGNSISLGTLNLSQNNFHSELPENIWQAPNLQILSASGSGVIGKLPDFEGCRSVYKIELAGNSLNGTIPWKIGHCLKLVSLNLGQNSLTGIIPWELSTLPAITEVDLSHNLLSGRIPEHFDNCTTLEIFNVSYNLLTGPIPSSSSGAMITNLHPSSFAGNAGLCGALIGLPCEKDMLNSPETEKKRGGGGAILWITAAAFGVGLFILLAGIRWFQSASPDSGVGRSGVGPWKLMAFQRLSFTAEDVIECTSMSEKILGMGSTGTVYKAEMPGGETIAVKKLWGKNKLLAQTARKARRGSSLLAEVEVLGSVRHRNIVRLLGCCSNGDATLLLYEYMPNGSLDDLIHNNSGNNNKGVPSHHDWPTRFNVALGVAHGICYLHHDCNPVIVHRDLKPSNILLDIDMEARVADFGVAKLIQSHESMSVIAGSYGYIAPEYAYTLQVDEKSDIYSFGVVLLEILTGKKSVEAEFGEGSTIVDWVHAKIKSKGFGVDSILDKNVGAACSSVREEMILVLRVALLCTSRNPADRPSMRDVVSMLHEAMPQRKLPVSGGGGGGGGGGLRDHVIEINCGGVESLGTSSSFEGEN